MAAPGGDDVTAMATLDIRHRLANPDLAAQVPALGFRGQDVPDLLDAVARALASAADLAAIALLADRLLASIGQLGPRPGGSVWTGCGAATDGLDTGVRAMLALLVTAPDVAAFHARRGIPPEVSAATLADLGQQAWVHRLVFDQFGLHTEGWLTIAWSGALYRVGRLQFNLQLDPGRADPRWVLSTHIPRSGPLGPESVDASLRRAREFFATHFPDYPAHEFYCQSWLLDPALAGALPDTNLAAFQRRWTLSGEPQPGDVDTLFFIFSRRPPVDPSSLPTDTRLRRLTAAKLAAGQSWSIYTGRLPFPEPVEGPLLTTLLPGFAGTTLPAWLETRLRAGLGGVCLFGPNITSLTQLRSLTGAIRAANPRAIIAVDEEGGDVTRLFADVGSPSPGNAVLGRLDDLAATRGAAADIGWQLRRAGCNVNFAPCVDLNSRADNPVIGVRSFGAVADQVARHSAAWVAGLQSSGVAATAKHFPGHGDTAQDSHVSLPVVDRSREELLERELVPFVAAINAGARLVMTSHIMLPQLDPVSPATMSRTVLLDLLRHELGFAGVIVSDALDMAGARSAGGPGEAAVRALRAGCDLLCLGTDNTDTELVEISDAVRDALAVGGLSTERVREAADRVLALAREVDDLRTTTPDTSEPAGWPWDDQDLRRSFDVTDAAGGWPKRAAGSYAVVRLEATPNMATGPTPWGPFAEVAREPTAPRNAIFAARPQFEVTPHRSELPPSFDTPVLVIGRDLHRHAFARDVVDQLRADRTDVLVVEMGWPADDRRYADVATYGSSRLIGRALLRFLAPAAGPGRDG